MSDLFLEKIIKIEFFLIKGRNNNMRLYFGYMLIIIFCIMWMCLICI